LIKSDSTNLYLLQKIYKYISNKGCSFELSSKNPEISHSFHTNIKQHFNIDNNKKCFFLGQQISKLE